MSMLVNPYAYGNAGAVPSGDALSIGQAYRGMRFGYNTINRRNPLSRGLIFASLAGGAPCIGPIVDAVSGKVGSKSANGIINGPFGPALGNASGSLQYNSAVVDLTPYHQITFALWGSYSAAGNDACFVTADIASPFNGFFNLTPTDGGGGVRVYMQGLTGGGASNKRWTLPSQGINNFHHWAVTADFNVANTAATQLYIDARIAALSSVITQTWAAGQTLGTARLIFLNHESFSAQLNGAIQHFAMWGRVLSHTEIVAHMTNPGQIYNNYI